MYVGDCNKCIYGFKCPCGRSLNSAACLTIAKKGEPKQTNADRIRSMSDEELVEFMYSEDISWCHDSECKTETLCKDCFRKWLQSEAK